jgi:hypothetical protein
LQTEHACIICIVSKAGINIAGVCGRIVGHIAETREDLFQAMNFQQLRRLAPKPPDTEIAPGRQ